MKNMTGHLFSIAVFKSVNVFVNLWSNTNYKYFAGHCTMAFPKHIMKLRVNSHGSNKENFLSVGVQHWSISGKEKGCSFGEWLLRIRGLFNSFAIAVLFQTTNRSLRSAPTRLSDSQSLLQILFCYSACWVSPSAKPDITSHISFCRHNSHWSRKPILRNFQPAWRYIQDFWKGFSVHIRADLHRRVTGALFINKEDFWELPTKRRDLNQGIS